MSKPSIIIVPGAWHVPAHYEPISSFFKSQGYNVLSIKNPTTGASDPAINQFDDAKAIRELIDSVGDVVIVMHSYGGKPGSIATKGAKNVIGLIFVAAHVLAGGKAVLDTPARLASCNDPRNVFYHDASDAEAEEAIRLLLPHNIAAFSTPSQETGWLDFPRAYAVMDDDKALLPQIQQIMADKAGGWLEIKHFDCGHSPWFHKRDEFNQWLQETVHRFEDLKSTA